MGREGKRSNKAETVDFVILVCISSEGKELVYTVLKGWQARELNAYQEKDMQV